jgi:hypothetical protein
MQNTKTDEDENAPTKLLRYLLETRKCKTLLCNNWINREMSRKTHQHVKEKAINYVAPEPEGSSSYSQVHTTGPYF